MLGTVRRVIAHCTAACAACGIIAVLPASAGASLVDLSHCDNSSLSQPFAQWGDQAYYRLAPGSDFEGTLSGWALQGGARQAAGSESYGVTGSVGASSLALPAGASAVSPATCVNAAYPDFRLFTRGNAGSSVAVSVMYNTGMGTLTIPVGVVRPTGDWQPTLPMATGSAIPGLLNGGSADVQLQFSELSGSSQIDDVFVDPFGRCC